VVSGPSQKTDISKLVSGSPLSIVWNTSTPKSVGPGTYWAIGTDTNGCTDTLIVDVCSKPVLNDTIVKVCPDQFRNLYGVYNLSGLIAEFDTPTPSAVSVGEYTIIVRNFCGGRDTAKIKVELGNSPQIGDFREILACKDEKVNLTIYFDITDDLVFNWSLPDPELAPIGRYSVKATNKDGCSSTCDIEVKPFEKPSFLNDTTVYVCGGTNRDLTTIFPYDELISYDWVGVSNPTSVPEGDYEVDVIDLQCIYRLKVHVKAEQTRKSELIVCNFTKGMSGVPFNTNNFRSVLVDKNGFIWAGADGNGINEGGLYRFVRTGPNCNQGSWSAEEKFPTIGFRDLQNSTVNGDNTVWSASNGNGAVGAVDGGVFRIGDIKNVTRFGSIDDGGPLRSRDVNTLAVAKNGLLYAGSFYYNPEFEVFRQGGVHEYNLLDPQTFTQVNGLQFDEEEVRVTALGIRGDELWVAGARNVSTIGVTFPPYIKRWSTSDHKLLGEINEGNSPIPFRSNNALIVRAIFTASSGKTFVGLSTGLAILEEHREGVNPKWHYLTHHNSAFPKGGSVSANAITEVNGEIWIGTNQGILVYDGVGPVNECSSYTIYNTGNTENLLSNNIRDVAYDAVNKEIWLVTDAGVSRVVKTFMISGRVMNVFYGRYDKDLFQRRLSRPIAGASVQLLASDGQLLSETTSNERGEFDLMGGLSGNTYKLDIKHLSYELEYSDIAANQFVGDIFIPDSLIKDLNFLKPLMASRNFTLKIPGAEAISIFWTVPPLTIDGFEVADFDNVMLPYQGKLDKNHDKQLENLANFYLANATMNEMANMATDHFDSASLVIAELVVASLEFKEMLDKVNKFFTERAKAASAKDYEALKPFQKVLDEMTLETVKQIQKWVVKILDESVRSKLSPDDKKVYDLLSLTVNQIFDQMASVEEGKDGIANLSKEDFIKSSIKLLSSFFSSGYYKYFTNVKHGGIVKDLANGAVLLNADEMYIDLYPKIYNKLQFDDFSSLSFLGKAINIQENANNQYLFFKGAGGTATLISEISNVAATVSTFTGVTAQFAPFFKLASTFSSIVNISSLIAASAISVAATADISALSEEVISEIGLMSSIEAEGLIKLMNEDLEYSTQLDIAFAELRTELNQLRILQSGSYSSAQYVDVLQEVISRYSNYNKLLDQINNRIVAKTRSAGVLDDYTRSLIENYNQKTDLVFRNSSRTFLLQNIGFISDLDRNFNWDSLPLFTSNLMESLPELNGRVKEILNILNQKDIIAAPLLVKVGYFDSTSASPGTSGRIFYSFRNFGDLPLENVSFTVGPPSAGFVIDGPSVFHFASIQPNQAVSFNFSYLNPLYDTIGEFTVSVKAGVDEIQNHTGLLITKSIVDNTAPISIKSGLWSDPTTWSTGLVPDETSAVIIRHEVTIDIDATCKSIRAENPAQVQVAAGKKLNILQ
jgi:hypothetical protein